MSKTNIVQSLRIKAEMAGTNLTEVCRTVGVSKNTITRWRKDEPKTIRLLRLIEGEIQNRAANIKKD